MSIIGKAKQLINDKFDVLSQLDIGWSNRPYDFYLIFGQKEESKSP